MSRWLVAACAVLWGFIPLLTWFQPGALITSTDLYLPTPPADWWTQLFVWNPRFGTGAEQIAGPSAVFSTGATAAVIALGGSERLAQQVDFVLWFMLPGLAFWWCLQQLTPKRSWVFHLVAVNVYMFNLFLEALWGGNKAGLSAYVALPLLIGVAYRGFTTGRWASHAAAFALVSLAGTAAVAHTPMTIVIGMAVGALAIWYAAAYRSDQGAVRRTVAFVIAAGILTAACHAFWLLPQLLLSQELLGATSMAAFAQESLSWLSGLSANTSLHNVVRMQGAWTWYQGWNEPYHTYSAMYQQQPLFLLLGWGWILLVGVGVWVSRRWLDGYFILLGCLGVLFGTGIHTPFGPIYAWLVRHLPLFSLIRSPWYKFTLLTCLAYAYLIGQAAEWISLRCQAWFVARSAGVRPAALVPALAGLAIVAANMVYAFPVTTGRMYPTPQERKYLKPAHVRVPSYVEEAGRWFETQPGFFRIFHTPKHTNGASSYRWGFSGIPPVLYHTTTRPLLFGTANLAFQESGNRLVPVALDALYRGMTDHVDRLLGLVGARYVLQEDDFEYDAFEQDGDDPTFMAARLAEQPALRRERSFGPWHAYRVEGVDPQQAHVAAEGIWVEGRESALIPLANAGWLSPAPLLVFADSAAASEIASRAPLPRACLDGRQVGSAPPAVLGASQRLITQSTADAAIAIAPDTVWPDSEIAVRVEDRWFTVRPDAAGVPWGWLDSASTATDAPQVVLTNRTGQDRTVHFQLTAQSHRGARGLYLYLNGEMAHATSIPGDTAQTVVVQGLRLRPGENRLRFYTHFAWDRLEDGTQVAFAFRTDQFRCGRLVYTNTLRIPFDDHYRLTVWRYGPGRRAEGTLTIQLDGQRLALPARAGTRAWGPTSVPLAAGDHAWTVAELIDGDHFAVTLESGQPSETPPAAGTVTVRSVDPTRYEGVMTITRPAMLVFNESYSARWELLDHATGRPITRDHWMVNGFANGFWIPAAGTYTFRLEHAGQSAVWLGWHIAWGAWGLCFMVVVVAAWRRGRR